MSDASFMVCSILFAFLAWWSGFIIGRDHTERKWTVRAKFLRRVVGNVYFGGAEISDEEAEEWAKLVKEEAMKGSN